METPSLNIAYSSYIRNLPPAYILTGKAHKYKRLSPSLTCLSVQVGNHIDILSKKWVAQDAGIGAGVDSYFEYLVKGAIMLQDEELLNMFQGNAHNLLLLPQIPSPRCYTQATPPP